MGKKIEMLADVPKLHLSPWRKLFIGARWEISGKIEQELLTLGGLATCKMMKNSARQD